MEARIIKDIPSLEKESLDDAADLHVPQSTPPIFTNCSGFWIA